MIIKYLVYIIYFCNNNNKSAKHYLTYTITGCDSLFYLR